MQSGSGISFSGLFSNLDTESIITQLMYIERAPVRLLEKKQLKLGYEKEELQTVNSSLLALKNSLKPFKWDGLAYDNTVTSGNTSVVTGSATTAATEGTYQVTVNNLAEANVVSSLTKSSTWKFGDESGGAAGTLAIFFESLTGPGFNVNVAANDDLEAIAGAINGSTGSLGEKFSDYGYAYVIKDSGNETLLVKSKNTGTDNKIFAIKNVGAPPATATIIGLRQAGGALNEIKAAENASVTIDGITISSSTNVVSNAINGVTLNLYEEDGPVEVRVGVNEDEIVQKVSAFISQFNSTTDMLSGYITEKPVQNAATESDLRKGVLFGDFDLISTKSDIRMKTTGFVAQSTSEYKLLAQIGITSEASYGSSVSSNLEFDEASFRAALKDNKDEVIAMLEEWVDGPAASPEKGLDYYLEKQTKVSVIDSDAGNFYRRMLSIDDRIDGIDDDISSWESRLLSMEERMRDRFTAMEEALQKMQSQSTYLSNQLNSLVKSTSSK